MTVAETEATQTGALVERRSTRGAWLVVFRQEVVELWVGGRAINLLILYSLLLGLMTFLLATNSELSLIPPKEMVFLTMLNTISFGVFIGMIVGADGISGERERGTLEVLLLTPTSRRQLILGKLLAALTPWPAAFLISVPALFVVSQGDESFGRAMVLGVLLGSVLAVAFAGFGLLVSTWSNSNKTSPRRGRAAVRSAARACTSRWAPSSRLNPGGVLPVVIAVPLGVTVALLLLVRLRLRRLGRDETDEDGVERAA